MSSHPWDASASVLRYPPLGANGASDPVTLFTGSLRECFEMAAQIDALRRLNVEIETADSEALYNSVDIEGMIAAGAYC